MLSVNTLIATTIHIRRVIVRSVDLIVMMDMATTVRSVIVMEYV